MSHARLLIAALCVAGGQSLNWINGTGGAFHDAANWDPAIVPGTLDEAVISDGVMYTISVGLPAASTTLIVDDVDVTFALGGNTYALQSAEIGVEPGPIGRLGAQNGTLAFSAGQVVIGVEPAAEGELLIRAGALLSSTVEVIVGDAGNGLLGLAQGGDALLGVTTLGDDPGATGTVTVEGAGSQWTSNGNVSVGNAGTGDVFVLDGGAATWIGLTRIGDATGATGQVTVSDAALDVQSELFIGNFGTGSLAAGQGATITTARVKIGDEIGAVGTVTIDGPGTTWTDSVQIFVGNFGDGTMNVTGGAAVSTPLGTVGDDPGSTGQVTVGAASSWTSAGPLAVGNLGQGTLTLAGGVAAGSSVAISTLSRVEGVGTLAGSTTSDGTVHPGAPAGTLAVTGNYVQSTSGTFEVELACTGGGTLAVSGAALLSGGLDVVLPAGSEPAAGQQFDILTAAAVAGTFDQVTASVSVTVSYLADRVTVTVNEGAPPVPGDITGDGLIGTADLLALLGVWGPCLGCPADLDGSGTVGTSDLLILLGNWGDAGCG